MAHLCSRYLEKKLLQLHNKGIKSGYRSEDEVYGFLPTPFRRKRKRKLHSTRQRTTSHSSVRKRLFAAGEVPQSQLTDRSDSRPRDVTNNHMQNKTGLQIVKQPKTETSEHFELLSQLDNSRQSFSSATSIQELVQKDNSETLNYHRERALTDSNKSSRHTASDELVNNYVPVSQWRLLLKNNYRDELSTSRQPSETDNYQVSQFDSCELSQQERWPSTKRITPPTSCDAVTMAKLTYPRTLAEVDDYLLISSVTIPANIVMFVVKRHFLRGEDGHMSDQKTCIGMLVNALYANASEIFIKLPNGHVGFVPKDTLKPVGVKTCRDFTQQYPENSTLDMLCPDQHCSEVATNSIPHIFDTLHCEFKKADHFLDTSSYSEGTFTNSTFNSSNNSFELPSSEVVAQINDAGLRLDSAVELNRILSSETQSDVCEELVADDCATETSTDRQSLLDYLKLLENNVNRAPCIQDSTVATPLVKIDNKVTDSNDEDILLSQNCIKLINSCLTCVESEPESRLNSTEINSQALPKAVSDSNYVDMTSGKAVDFGDISRISLRDITYRPAINSTTPSANNIYQNIPDVTQLMKHCSVKNNELEHSQSNDSGISQTYVTSIEFPSETGKTDTGEKCEQIKSSHERSGSTDTSLIGRCGSYRNILCQSADCAMCCPCKSCGFEYGSCATKSSSTPCIDDLSSIHAASSTMTSDLTLVTSPESVTSAVTSFTSNASINYNACCSFIQNKTPREFKSISHTDNQRQKCKKSEKSSSRNGAESSSRSIDLLKTIESIETTDSGNWSELSSDCEDIVEETRPPRLTALFDYAKKSVYDVSMCKQEVVTLINDQHPDWLWVENESGDVGYIPRNYVVNLEKLNLDPHTKTTYL